MPKKTPKVPHSWSPYLWIAAYAAAALCWLAISLLVDWGTGATLVLIGAVLLGVLGINALGNLIASGRPDGGKLQ